MKTTEQLLAEFKAKGGQITKCPDPVSMTILIPKGRKVIQHSYQYVPKNLRKQKVKK